MPVFKERRPAHWILIAVLGVCLLPIARSAAQPSYTAYELYIYTSGEQYRRDARFIDFNARREILLRNYRADSYSTVLLYRNGQLQLVLPPDSSYRLESAFGRLNDNGVLLLRGRQAAAPFEEFGVVYDPADQSFLRLSNRPPGQAGCPDWDDSRAYVNQIGDVFARLKVEDSNGCNIRYGVWPAGAANAAAILLLDTMPGYPYANLDPELWGVDRFNGLRQVLVRGRGPGQCIGCTNAPHNFPYIFDLDSRSITPLPPAAGVWTGSEYNLAEVNGITNTGVAYGRSTAFVDSGRVVRATIWENGTPQVVDDGIGAFTSAVVGMSDQGLALVERQRTDSTFYEMLIWDGAGLYPLADVIANDTLLNGNPVPPFQDRNQMRIRMNARGDLLVHYYFPYSGGTIYRENGTMLMVELDFVPEPLVVNSTADNPDANPGDGQCKTGRVVNGQDECTLRAALMEANAGSGLDTIRFNIPGGGQPVISVSTALPEITAPVVIDGRTQPGADYVEIQGAHTFDTLNRMDGLVVRADSTLIRGLSIYGFSGNGIRIDSADGCVLERNIIGASVAFDTTMPNQLHGVLLRNVNGARIGGKVYPDTFTNIITNNMGAGVYVESGRGAFIEGNSIYGNGGLGIDLAPLGVNANDSLDVDTGANTGLNYPLIRSVVRSDRLWTRIFFSYQGTPHVPVHITFYASRECDESGYGEGQRYFAGAVVTPGDDGWSLSNYAEVLDTLLPGESVTATANDYTETNSTSEFSLCWFTPEYCLRDANDRPIREKWLQWSVVDSAPDFPKKFGDSVKTDSLGCVSSDSLLETFRPREGDAIRFFRVLDTSGARKHGSLLPTRWSLELDNAKFDSVGTVYFDTVKDSGVQMITLDHVTFAYNVVVSIEWDATPLYLEGTMQAFRNMSNYLYDVTDGQARFDTVMIFDNKEHWDEADFQIFATTEQWPKATPRGIDLGDGYSSGAVYMPRKWMGTVSPAIRDSIYRELSPLVTNVSDFRSRVHEFGHYAFGFRDEYKFVTGKRCSDRPDLLRPYGFMDYHYPGGEPYASEMSNDNAYKSPDCRNTAQWSTNYNSCWAQFALEHSAIIDSIAAFVKTPEDRPLKRGLDYLPGPNDNLAGLDYDVGKLVVFPVAPAPPSANIIQVRVVTLGGDSLPGVDVYQLLTLSGRVVAQGKSGSDGRLTALGVNLSDVLFAAGRVRSEGGFRRGLAATEDRWTYGQATVGGSGVSPFNNAYRSFGVDSLLLELRRVEGDLPLLVTLDYTDSLPVVSLTVKNFFSEPPAMEFAPGDATPAVMTVAATGVGYRASLHDTLTDAGGTLAVRPLDTTGAPFFFNAYCRTAFFDSVRSYSLVGYQGACEVTFDTSNTTLHRAAVLTVSYPVIRTGLDPRARQAGDAHALAVDADAPLSGDNAITIRYADGDLGTGDAFTDEASLRVFHWDEAAAEWKLVGGTVDTLFNEVRAAITEPGVYALFSTEILTGIGDHNTTLPNTFTLGQNYPNPFNPATAIEFTVPRRSHVTIDIFNVLGQRVRRLVDGPVEAGIHRVVWDGRNESGMPVASGVYLYRMVTGGFEQTRKMLLLK